MAQEPYTDNQDLLQMAIRAAKGGQKDGARVMFRQIYERDRRNETVMLWLARIARNDQEREGWLNRLLEYNPDNLTAKKALQKIQYKRVARNNRMLVFYGVIAALMVLLLLVVLLVAL